MNLKQINVRLLFTLYSKSDLVKDINLYVITFPAAETSN